MTFAVFKRNSTNFASRDESEAAAVSFLKWLPAQKEGRRLLFSTKKRRCVLFDQCSETPTCHDPLKQGPMAQSFTGLCSDYGTDPGIYLLPSEIRIESRAMALYVDSTCAQCQEPVPKGRTRFCSNECLIRHKREGERMRYGHRHEYQCVKCGHQLRLGRHRK